MESGYLEESLAKSVARELYLRQYRRQRSALGFTPPAGLTWNQCAPPTPAYAENAAWRLLGRLEQANDLPLSVVIATARRAQGKDPKKDGCTMDFLRLLGERLVARSVGEDNPEQDSKSGLWDGLRVPAFAQTKTIQYEGPSQ